MLLRCDIEIKPEEQLSQFTGVGESEYCKQAIDQCDTFTHSCRLRCSFIFPSLLSFVPVTDQCDPFTHSCRLRCSFVFPSLLIFVPVIYCLDVLCNCRIHVLFFQMLPAVPGPASISTSFDLQASAIAAGVICYTYLSHPSVSYIRVVAGVIYYTYESTSTPRYLSGAFWLLLSCFR